MSPENFYMFSGLVCMATFRAGLNELIPSAQLGERLARDVIGHGEYPFQEQPTRLAG